MRSIPSTPQPDRPRTFAEFQADELAYVEGKLGRPIERDELADLMPVLHLAYEGVDVTDPKSGVSFPVRCLTCADTGWFRDERDTLVPCRSCPDVAEAQSRRRFAALAIAGLPSNREPKALDAFDPALQTGEGRSQAEDALRYVKEWCAGDLPLLLLVGTTGVGKTHLAEGAADRLVRMNQSVNYVLGAWFTHQMRPRRDENMGSEGSQFDFRDRLMAVPWLILDEVGSAHDKGWIASQYQDIVLYRVGQGLPTLLAGNFGGPDEGIDALTALLGDRLASRLAEGKSGHIASLWRLRPKLAFQKGAG